MDRSRILCVVAGLAGSSVVAGCSQDKHVFHSTVDQPKTVLITEPYRQEVLWSKDVPVQHKLVVDFDREGEYLAKTAPNRPATSMHWKLLREGEYRPIMEGTEYLPGTPISMQVALRPAPEYPGTLPPAGMSSPRPVPRVSAPDERESSSSPAPWREGSGTTATYGTDGAREEPGRAAQPDAADLLDLQDR